MTLLEEIAELVRPGGKLIITQLGGMEDTEVHPMHQKISFNAEQVLNSRGFFRADREWLWIRSATGYPHGVGAVIRT
jgi:hypothetical protein